MEANSSAAGAAPLEDAAETRPAWRVRYTEVHGRRYGLRDVALLDPDALLCIEGSGGARSFTPTVCTFPGTNRDEEHAALIAAAPDLLTILKQARREYGAFTSLSGETLVQIDAAISRAALSKAGV